MAYRNILSLSAGIALIATRRRRPALWPCQRPDRDRYCRHEAAASTGYVTPGEAASRGSSDQWHVRRACSPAAPWARIIGGAAGNAGAGAAIGAGTGLVAGSAIGSENARQAARDVRHDWRPGLLCPHGSDAKASASPPDRR